MSLQPNLTHDSWLSRISHRPSSGYSYDLTWIYDQKSWNGDTLGLVKLGNDSVCDSQNESERFPGGQGTLLAYPLTPWDPAGPTLDPLGPCSLPLTPWNPFGPPPDPLEPCRVGRVKNTLRHRKWTIYIRYYWYQFAKYLLLICLGWVDCEQGSYSSCLRSQNLLQSWFNGRQQLITSKGYFHNDHYDTEYFDFKILLHEIDTERIRSASCVVLLRP